ncbi:sigma-54-dependent transcriptional regulator [Paraburkholderia hospita]|jgi:DNA-binding NtrC family response regulator|uniref:Sigma-54-dependent Fis family transcriptional regulator n=1 Tax=Paraburkholderia hospita TaxID=169430 RepID=A0AAJ4T0A9_9BURK|nr:sigma-54 dependent transcriptional regulator [Paraburkholderia hospita]EUC14158.1 two component, sigma54 specific, transcriptional regulator, Fis family [Burkholderia sp. BT03]SKC80613.1 two component, sigma54 specific, transcriptional regulator, NtrC subfamily, Fis family [Burkholderia sp. CF099]SOE65833.1 two component, sigma54 specific, transcriptional regulator, NtrC subfamily, Fis family [Burkholderia sp. YR290]AUT68977.1 sigma-54-dependent Fis family transcriptional regulator [Paraburk
MPHVLIVDDDPSTREALAAIIAEDGLTTATAGDLREARIQLVRQTPDVVFTDLKLPDGSGVDLFEDLDPRSGVEFVVITGHATVESAVSALKMGAADYLVKPINMQRVKAILSRLPRAGDLKAEIGTLRGELRRMGRFGLMLGNSPIMQQVYDQISRVAPTAASVMLVGESGTGKEVAAQTLHQLSLRRKHAFLAVNCGAISPNLIESEMFGHERGAFTGADRQHKGYFERANGGTLFLDEITEMPIELQVKLLRVLETGMFMRVGTTKEIETDVRLIAATNRDPEQAVLEGKLRLDLYHRLNVFPISLPPLRERGKDVELLAQAFLDDLNEQHTTKKHFPPAVKEMLLSYPWPGNVRELKNYVQRAHIMAGTDSDSTATVPLQISLSKPTAGTAITIPFGTSLAEADRQLILATLEQCGGVKTRAAEILGISLKTLYNRLVEYGNDAGRADGDDVSDESQALGKADA